jgi:hypothetical protein
MPNGGSEYYSEYIKKYIEWISNIPGKFRRIIIAPYPSPLDQKHTLSSLINYGSLTKEDVDKYYSLLEFCASNMARQTRYYEFLYSLNKYCNEFSFNRNIIYINLNNHILNENLVVKNEFRDVSEYNMHLRWKPVIECLIREFAYNDIPITDKDIIENIDETEANYEKEKTKWLVANKDYWSKNEL